MTADPRDTISGFTEMTDAELAQHIAHFFRAVGAGMLAGGAPFAVLTVPAGAVTAMRGEVVGGLFFAASPLLIAGGVTLLGMLLLGIPLTMILFELRRESAAIYAWAGALFGQLACVAFTVLTIESLGAGILLGIPGMLAGAVAGKVWGERRAALSQGRQFGGPASRGTAAARNPIHDMIY